MEETKLDGVDPPISLNQEKQGFADLSVDNTKVSGSLGEALSPGELEEFLLEHSG